MRRALAFCSYQADWWASIAADSARPTSPDPALDEGRAAFAQAHAAQELDLRAAWAAQWYKALVAAKATGLVKLISVPDVPQDVVTALPVLDLRRGAGAREGAIGRKDGISGRCISFVVNSGSHALQRQLTMQRRPVTNQVSFPIRPLYFLGHLRVTQGRDAFLVRIGCIMNRRSRFCFWICSIICNITWGLFACLD
jgi:hypothetical protein